jgi:hypothetical protein
LNISNKKIIYETNGMDLAKRNTRGFEFTFTHNDAPQWNLILTRKSPQNEDNDMYNDTDEDIASSEPMMI